jgi:NADH-quinone oxidoreductase subunit J
MEGQVMIELLQSLTAHLPQILFYAIGAGMLGMGVFVITSRNPVNSAMFLVALFFGMAALFVVLGAYFLAAVQILVYAGAIMVLFLFAIMFLNLAEEIRRRLRWFSLVNGVLLVFLLALQFALLMVANRAGGAGTESVLPGTTKDIGRLLFSSYLVPFETASVLLLAAIIGAFVLAHKEEKE